jgi:hypothetical protein
LHYGICRRLRFDFVVLIISEKDENKMRKKHSGKFPPVKGREVVLISLSCYLSIIIPGGRDGNTPEGKSPGKKEGAGSWKRERPAPEEESA